MSFRSASRAFLYLHLLPIGQSMVVSYQRQMPLEDATSVENFLTLESDSQVPVQSSFEPCGDRFTQDMFAIDRIKFDASAQRRHVPIFRF